MNVSLFEDKIAFTFVEDVVNGGFASKTESGIFIQEDHSKQVHQPRLGKVIQCGPECTEVQEGDVILIEATMWTNGIELEDSNFEEFWLTRERNVIAIKD